MISAVQHASLSEAGFIVLAVKVDIKRARKGTGEMEVLTLGPQWGHSPHLEGLMKKKTIIGACNARPGLIFFPLSPQLALISLLREAFF